MKYGVGLDMCEKDTSLRMWFHVSQVLKVNGELHRRLLQLWNWESFFILQM